MPYKVPQEIGDLWDIGIETQDASTITVSDRSGRQVALSQVAFVTSTLHQTEESTELQEKAKLVQLQDAIIDREFDQWIQNSQGDWSNGIYQRVRGGPNSDPARYFDGQGLLWPISDYLPSQPFQPPVYQDAANAIANSYFRGVVGGFIDGSGSGTPGNGYAYTYEAAGGAHTVVFIGSGVSQTSRGVAAAAIQDMCIGHGTLWTVQANGANLELDYWRWGVPPNWTLTAFLTNALAGTTTAVPAMSCGMVGNQQYVAIVGRKNPATGLDQDTIVLYNVTSTTSAFNTASSVTLTLPTGWDCTQTGFLGDAMIVSITDGFSSAILSYSISASSWTTLVQLPGDNKVHFCNAAGGLFLLAHNHTLNAAAPNIIIKLYLLQGGNLQDIGPLAPTYDGGSGSTEQTLLVGSVLRPAAFGRYVVFAVVGQVLSGGTLFDLVYAYDLLQGRLFKVIQYIPVPTGNNQSGWDDMPLAVFGARDKLQPADYTMDWGFAVPLINLTANPNHVQEFSFGVLPFARAQSAPIVPLQLPTSIISPMVDFTSAQNKLYKQVTAAFSPLLNDANQSVTLKVWLDKDVSQINVAPDYTAQVTGGPSTVGQSLLNLFINKVARKLVYQVITTGGVYANAAWHDAPKLISVAVQASTGWAWHIYLAGARSAKKNSGSVGDYAWDSQPGGTGNQIQTIDEVAAYNFLRQIWRQKGGLMKVTLPNGDSFNAKMQKMVSAGPKPFGSNAGAPADTPDDRYQNVIELLFREDV